MSNLFIAVGGSGQNVALAYLRLAGLCGFKSADVYVVDCDLESPITNDLKNILNKLTKENTRQIQDMRIEPIPSDIPPTNLEGRDEKHFGNIFLDPPNKISLDIAKSVLFKENELNIDIGRGMYGFPSVGASAIMAKIKEVDRDADDINL